MSNYPSSQFLPLSPPSIGEGEMKRGLALLSRRRRVLLVFFLPRRWGGCPEDRRGRDLRNFSPCSPRSDRGGGGGGASGKMGWVGGIGLVVGDFREGVVPVRGTYERAANFHPCRGKICCAGEGGNLAGRDFDLVKPGFKRFAVPVRNDDLAVGLVRFHPERNAGECNPPEFRASGSVEKYDDLILIVKESGSTGGRTAGEEFQSPAALGGTEFACLAQSV